MLEFQWDRSVLSFLYCEAQFMAILHKDPYYPLISLFNNNSIFKWYLNFLRFIKQISSKVCTLNKDYIRNDSCQFLDIDIPFPMLISHTHLRQKNWFLFPIPMSIFLLDGDIHLNNLVPSYGVYISQLVRFADTCICNVSDFNEGNHLARIRITLPDLTLPHFCAYP